MRTLYLDTEFNGFGGKLMSMALVPSNDTFPEFYRELVITEQLHPWVQENVVPHMFLVPSTYNQFQNALADYLWRVGDCIIVADWPDDIRYFCQALITGPGMCMNLLHNMGFYLDFGIDYDRR